MQKCTTCPRNCNIDRNVGVGFCGADKNLKIAKIMLHQWEEPLVSGTDQTRGSGAIFFSNCNLKCIFCQNWQISNGKGNVVSVKQLAQIFKQLEDAGAYNINLVSPTHYTDQILSALDIYKPKIPIVWNTNGYENVQNINKIKDAVDVFLTDLKYKSPDLCAKFSGARDYFDFASKAILQMAKNQPNDIIKNGMIQKGLIIRHLILPNCTKDSMQILDWIKKNMGTNHILSLMSQYTPCFKATQDPTIHRKLKPIEYKQVLHYAQKLGFENGFSQDFDSNSKTFIPDFENCQITKITKF